MKLTAVNNTSRQNRINNSNNKAQNTSFKGVGDMAVSFWKFVDAGGRGLQFTVEDMFGTNFPRTYKGAMAGYKYTGEVNVPALIQEALREFLTGPTMTCAPIAILAVITKLAGKTADTRVDNIKNLSYLASTLPKETTKETFREDFIKTTVEDMLKQTTGKDANKEDVETLVEGIKKYGDLIKQSEDEAKQGIKGAKKTAKATKKEAKKSLGELADKFSSMIKARKDDYTGVNFKTAKFTMKAGEDAKAVGFENYVKYINAYVEDYSKHNIKDGVLDLGEKAIEAFKKNWIGKRRTTIVSMIALTGIIMSFIPKIYTLASGTVNPNAANIYNEAQKKEGK